MSTFVLANKHFVANRTAIFLVTLSNLQQKLIQKLKKGGRMASAEHESIMEPGGGTPQRDPEQSL